MKCLTSLIFAAFALSAVAEDAWTEDFAAARTKAAEENKDLVLLFTGSDWCPPCMMLEKQVLGTEEFQKAADEDFVLVKLDFPQVEADLDEATAARNQELQQRYGIEGYPTLVLTDAKGRPYATTGYRDDEPAAYAAHLEEFGELKKQRDEALAQAEEKTGEEKVAAIERALLALPLPAAMLGATYPDEVAALREADDGDSVLVRRIAQAEKLSAFQNELQQAAQGGDEADILAVVDRAAADPEFDPEGKQQVIFTKAMVLANLGRFDDSLAALDEAKEVAPESEVATHIDQIRPRLIEARDEAAKEEAAPEPAEDAPEE